MTREEILIEVFNSQILNKMANKYKARLGSDADEFVSHCISIVCEMPEEKLLRLYKDGQLYFYIVSIAKNQAWNDNSVFNKNVIERGIIKIDINTNAKDSKQEF